MKTLTFITCLVIFGLSTASVSANDLEETTSAPAFSITDSTGHDLEFPTRNKGVDIYLFWATWCPYCKALMPHVQSIRLEYGDQVKILAIQIKDKKDPMPFIEDAAYDFTVFPHGDEVAELYEIHGTPGVIVVDRDQLMRFDLRAVPRPEFPTSEEKPSHGKKAAYLAPYWAAELRKALDVVLDES